MRRNTTMATMTDIRDGDYSPLEYPRNNKYRHHPVAALTILSSERCFRHVSLERMARIVTAHGSKRQVQGRWHKTGEDEAIDLDGMEREMAIRAGVSCATCDDLSWHGCPPDTDGEYLYRLEHRDPTRSPMVMARNDQWHYCCLLNSSEHNAPALCQRCFAIARRGNDNASPWSAGEWVALRGLLQILCSLIPGGHTATPRRMAKRRRGSKLAFPVASAPTGFYLGIMGA